MILVIVLNPILVIYIFLAFETQHVFSEKIDIKLSCLFHLFSLPFVFVFLGLVCFLKHPKAKHSYYENFVNLPLSNNISFVYIIKKPNTQLCFFIDWSSK